MRFPGAAALLALALGGCTCRGVVGPEAAIGGALASLPGSTFALADGCGALRIQRVSFDHLLVKTSPAAAGYLAIASADVDAEWEGARVSYLGVERVPFSPELRLERTPLPALAEVLEVLCRRERALAAGDPAQLATLLAPGYSDPRASRAELLDRVAQTGRGPRRARIDAAVRTERERAEVRETFRSENGSEAVAPPVNSSPGDARRFSVRTELVREGGLFRISSGSL